MTVAERIRNLSQLQRALLLRRLRPGEPQRNLAEARPETLPLGSPENAPGSDVERPVTLVAYIVCRSGQTTSPAALQKFLRPSLPQFMVPSRFVFLTSFPCHPNGKIDRGALPEPEAEAHSDSGAPQTETEAQLAKIWAQALRVERVGIHDDFFRLGGHSLLALQVMTRVRDAFQADLAVRTIFENPTIAGLARAIEQQSRNTSATSIRRVARPDAEALRLQLD